MSTAWRELLATGARVLWLAFPVAFAAALHVGVLRLRLFERLKRPLDGGRCWRGARLFGDHKTVRGAVVMVAGSIAGFALQQRWRVPSLELFDYSAAHAWGTGALLGLGFVVGELPNSFLKRRAGIPPGRHATGPGYWLFTALDQLDSVVGGLVALSLAWRFDWLVVPVALLLCTLLHVAFNAIFVLVGLKERVL
jgi:hypothetical protein